MFASNIFPTIWCEFVKNFESLDTFLKFSKDIVEVIQSICGKLLLDSENNLGKTDGDIPYAGFDKRDIHDFNMQGFETGETNVDFKAEHHAAILVLMHLLFQMYCNGISVLQGLVRTQRVEQLGFAAVDIEDVKSASVSSIGDCPTTLLGVTTVLTDFVTALTNPMLNLSEEEYLQSIKTISAINFQLVAVDIVGSTEVITNGIGSLFFNIKCLKSLCSDCQQNLSIAFGRIRVIKFGYI